MHSLVLSQHHNVSECKTTVFRKRSPLFWAGGECGVVLVLVGTRYKLVALPGYRTSTPRCPSPCQPTTDEKSITYVGVVWCGACNAAVSHTLKNFVATQLPVSQMANGRKSARLTELTELTIQPTIF
jgi:hypothetical protein